MLTAPGTFDGRSGRLLPLPLRTGRRLDLDAQRGLAIFLVVVGHAVARGRPRGNDWHAVLKRRPLPWRVGTPDWILGAVSVPALPTVMQRVHGPRLRGAHRRQAPGRPACAGAGSLPVASSEAYRRRQRATNAGIA